MLPFLTLGPKKEQQHKLQDADLQFKLTTGSLLRSRWWFHGNSWHGAQGTLFIVVQEHWMHDTCHHPNHSTPQISQL